MSPIVYVGLFIVFVNVVFCATMIYRYTSYSKANEHDKAIDCLQLTSIGFYAFPVTLPLGLTPFILELVYS